MIGPHPPFYLSHITSHLPASLLTFTFGPLHDQERDPDRDQQGNRPYHCEDGHIRTLRCFGDRGDRETDLAALDGAQLDPDIVLPVMVDIDILRIPHRQVESVRFRMYLEGRLENGNLRNREDVRFPFDIESH